MAIKHRIDAIYTDCPFYGSRKIQVLLHPEFGSIARNTVRRYMHEMGIAAIYPGLNLSKRHTEQHIYPYLLRGVTAAYPNHVWGIEEIYLYDYDSPRAARHGITRYMTRYNGQRPHQALGYQTPAAVYFAPPTAGRGF